MISALNSPKLGRLPGLLLIILMFACNDDGDEKPKSTFSGLVEGTNESGPTVPLVNFPLEISFYKSYPLAEPVPAKIVEVATDSEGKYKLSIETDAYKGYAIKSADPYYGSCFGIAEPDKLTYYFPVLAENEKDLPLCITGNVKISVTKTSLENHTLYVNYKAMKQGWLVGGVDTQLVHGQDFTMQFFSTISEVEFIFTVKNSENVVVETTEITEVPVPGTTQTLNFEF